MIIVITFKIQNFFKLFRWLIVAVCVIGLYGILPQLKEFRSVPSLLGSVYMVDVSFAVVCSLFTVLFAAVTYRILAPRKLPYIRTLVVEFASGFFNRIVPAGLGGLGVNYLYFRKSKMTKAQSFGVLALNNGLGAFGHLLLLTGIILYDPSLLHGFKLHLHYSNADTVIWLIVLVIIGFAIYFHQRLKRFIDSSYLGFRHFLLYYKQGIWKLVFALVSSMLVTSSYLLALYFCSRALGLNIHLATLFLSLSFGVLLGSSSLSPGGIGTTEIGLISVLVSFGVGTNDALALALLYRIVSFWMTFILGAFGEILVRKFDYV